MPLVKNVEKKIWDIEGFDVTIKTPDGANVRGDKSNFPQYNYNIISKSDWTVSEWKEKRFKKLYLGYDVDVLKVDGSVAAGQSRLGTIRDTYIDEE